MFSINLLLPILILLLEICTDSLGSASKEETVTSISSYSDRIVLSLLQIDRQGEGDTGEGDMQNKLGKV